MTTPSRAGGSGRGVRSAAVRIWRKRPADTAALMAAFALLVVVLYFGGRLIGLPLPVPGLDRPTATVRFDPPIKAITRTGVVRVAGTTQPAAFVTAFVDDVAGPSLITGPDGRFDFQVELKTRRDHQIRVEVRYGEGRVSEAATADVRYVEDAVPTPIVVAVDPWPRLNGYYVLLNAEPGATIAATGAGLEQLEGSKVGPAGRASFLIKVDPAAPPTLTATDEDGVVSAPTAPLDLAALASAEPEPKEVEATVIFTIDRRDVTRTWTATLDRERRELTRLTTGAVHAVTFLEEVTGPAGIAPFGLDGCLVRPFRAGQVDLAIGDQATITLVDSFPGVVTQWNGFTDSPGLTLCMPRGMPARQDTGYVEVHLRDFVFASASIAPSSARTEQTEDGVTERIYRWDRIPFETNVDLRFGPLSPSIMSLVPHLDPAVGDADLDGRARFIDALVWRFIRSAGTIALLALIAAGLGSQLRSREAPFRRVLEVALAFGLVSAMPRADLVALQFSIQPILLSIENDGLRAAVAEWLIVGLVVVLALAAHWWARRRRRRLLQSLSLALAMAGTGWFAVIFLGRGALAAVAVTVGTNHLEWVRLASWLCGIVVLVVPMTYVWLQMQRIIDPAHERPKRWRLALWVLVAAVLAALMSLPAGVEGAVDPTNEAAWSWMRSTFGNVASLATFVAPVIAFVLVIELAHRRWTEQVWFEIDAQDPSVATTARWHDQTSRRYLLPAIATAMFAGFAITTGGGLQPLSFVLALAVFAIWLRRPADLERDAVAQREAVAAASAPSNPPVESSASAGSPEQKPEPPHAFPIWSNVRFAIQCGLVLVIVPLVLYIAQYPIAQVSREDPLYLQHVLVALGSVGLGWLFVALTFGLAYDHLHGGSGIRKGLLLGLAILLITVPFQAVYGILTAFSPLELSIWVFDVLAFTTLLGVAFDLRELAKSEALDFFQPNKIIDRLKERSKAPALITAIAVVLGSIVSTTSGLITNQIVAIVTQVVAPFLPQVPK